MDDVRNSIFTFNYSFLLCYRINDIVLIAVVLTLPSYMRKLPNITGGGAPISRQSKKCRQKHGGFSCFLTPIGSSGSWQLPLTNRDPTLEIKSFTPLVFAKSLIIIFEFRLKILIFLQSRKKCVSFKFLVCS